MVTRFDSFLEDAKATIASSYESIAEKYHTWASPRPTTDRAEYINQLSTLLPPKSKVLELGCGSGIPATQHLCSLGYDVTGIDGSSSLINIAKKEIPQATFIVSDMSKYNPTGEKYDAVCAFYTLWHLPPDDIEDLLKKACKEWVKEGGWVLFNLMTSKGELKMDSWMGKPMISWGLGIEGNKELVKRLIDEGLIDVEEKGGTGIDGEIKKEMVGKYEQEMHWFLIRTIKQKSNA